MRRFHQLLKDVTEDIIQTGRRITPTNLSEVIGLGEKRTISDLTTLEQPNTCKIAVLNGRCINTCNLEHQSIADSYAKIILQKIGK